MSVGVARLAIKDEEKVRRAMDQVLGISHLRGEDWQVTSPEITSQAWLKIREVSGQDDPLKEVKAEQNTRALQVYPLAKEIVSKSPDPFLQALKFAIAGNSLDAMVTVKEGLTDDLIEALGKLPVDLEGVRIFRERLDKSRKIVYFTDNCGEIVFDKLFLEVIRQTYQGQITIVTRTMPILNDATMKDAIFVGLDQVAPVVENGINVPFPGTIISKLSPEVKKSVEESELVISKGVGNYDSLTEETQLRGKISFLFHGKCLPSCAPSGHPLGALVVFNF
jgi:hypothetical protein